jgi:hypothetical protein
MYFEDACSHGQESYIGSFSIFEPGDKEHNYDLYVFNTKHGQEVCIRYGNESYEYYSPGFLADFITSISLLSSRRGSSRRSCQLSVYGEACTLMLEKGAIVYSKF